MEYLDFILIFFIALVLSIFFTPLLLVLAHKKQLYDQPDFTNDKSRRVHFLPTPRIGGISIIIAFFTTIAFSKTFIYFPIFACSFVLFALGLWDDLKNLSPKIRLYVQITSSILVVHFANLSLQYINISPHYGFQLPYLVGFLFSVFIIIGAINSINMVDGLDGLASGASFIGIAILSYFIFLIANKNPILSAYTIPLLGVLIGFLKFNTYPSKIFMGDSGSNWLGFLIGVLIIKVANLDRSIPFVSIILAFAIPIFDTAHVIIMRLLNGQNPMHADNRHLHHSLMKVGFSHAQSVGILYFFMFFFGTLGMIPVAFPNYNLFWIPWFAVIVLVVFFGFIIPYQFTRLKKIFLIIQHKRQNKIVTKPIKALSIFIETFQRYALYALLFTSPIFVVAAFSPISLLCAVICFAMGVHFFIYKNCSFVSAAIIVCSMQILFSNANLANIQVRFLDSSFRLITLYNFIFLYLFLATVFTFTLTLKRKFFIITPTDILLVLIPLLILMIPDTWHQEYGLKICIAQSIVLFAALRIQPYAIQKAAQTSDITLSAADKSSDSIPSPNLHPNP